MDSKATPRMKIQLISKEYIKPSSPTPPHLRSYKLSLLDQLTTRIYVPLVFFYSNTATSPSYSKSKHNDTSRRLKISLTEILTKYYPFAGRLTDDRVTVACSDEGVNFVEAQVNCQLSEFLKHCEAESENLNMLFSEGFLWCPSPDSCNSSLVGVQVSFFDCGGVAISVSITHKIADSCTASTFLRDWAAATAGAVPVPPPPCLIATSILPLNNNNVPVPAEIEFEERHNCVTKRYLFDASKIAKLKAMAAANSGGIMKNNPTPTRVEVVTALIYKCAVASSYQNLGSFRKSLLIQLVNMRPRMVPPLPKNSVGNFSWYFTISQNEEKEMKLNELVVQLRNGLTQLSDKSTNNLKLNDWLAAVFESTKEVKMLFDDLEVYRCSSFCKYPLYQVDFGWGKPIWVAMADGIVKNTCVLMDNPEGDGIEVTVTLEKQDMGIFQRIEELLAFASPIH